jgi:hypothetical protein
MSANLAPGNTAPNQNDVTAKTAAAEPAELTLDEAMLERRVGNIVQRLQDLEQKVFGDKTEVAAPAPSGTVTVSTPSSGAGATITAG